MAEEEPTNNIRTKRCYRRSDVGPFKCKTCSKEFPSFQALGGHRAAHIRGHVSVEHKTHSCSMCDKKYLLRQSLCRHIVRRHSGESSTSNDQGDQGPVEIKKPHFDFDLNLTPFRNYLQNGNLSG